MKKCIICLLLLSLLMAGACAQTREWQLDGSALCYRTEDFGPSVPSELVQALADSPFAGDPILCATRVETLNSKTGETRDAKWLAAVSHEGSTLLVTVFEGEVTAIARDFNAGQDFYLTTQPLPYQRANGQSGYPLFFIVSGDRWIGSSLGLPTSISAAFIYHDSGDGTVIQCKTEPVSYDVKDFVFTGHAEPHYPFISLSLWDWDILSFPCTREEMLSLEQAQPLDQNLVYVSGCHMRARATSKSTSYGQFCAFVPIRLTGNTQPGTQLPWHEIEVGQMRCWVADNYLVQWVHTVKEGDFGYSFSDEQYLFTAMSSAAEVCRPVADVPLYAAYDGKDTLQTLSTGDTLTIGAQSDDMYLVCVSTQQPGRMIPGGIYGWVRKSDVVTAPNPVQLAFE